VLPTRYAELWANLVADFPEVKQHPERVYLVQYYDPTHDDAGDICTFAASDISQADWTWFHDGVLGSPGKGGLNDVLSQTAQQYGWTLVGGVADAYAQHGYCASNNWVDTLFESETLEGTRDGTGHPNEMGQAKSGDIERTYLTKLFYVGGDPTNGLDPAYKP